MARSINILVALFGLSWVSPTSFAQDLRDPTKPAISANAADGAVELEHVPVLQSILISPTRKFAVIDGKTVYLKAKFGDQVLVKLTENEAVLKRGREIQTLKMFPDVEKKMVQKSARSNAK